jgi:hypothetical protein
MFLELNNFRGAMKVQVASKEVGDRDHLKVFITRALNRKVVRVFNPSRKDRHWEKQNLETRRVTNSSCPQKCTTPPSGI